MADTPSGATVAEGAAAAAAALIELNAANDAIRAASSYYDQWIAELDDFERVLDQIVCVKKSVHEMEMVVDYPWLKHKQRVLYLDVPTPDMGNSAQLYRDQTNNDGDAVDNTSNNLAKYSCTPLPGGWEFRQGRNMSAMAQAYHGGMYANHEKRRQERFQDNKTALVLKSQQMSRVTLTGVIADLNGSMATHATLADLYAKGFNSAGLGAGVAIGNVVQAFSSIVTGSIGNTQNPPAATTATGTDATGATGGSGATSVYGGEATGQA